MSFKATARSEHSYNLLMSESRAQVYHLFSHTRQKLGINVVHPWWRICTQSYWVINKQPMTAGEQPYRDLY